MFPSLALSALVIIAVMLRPTKRVSVPSNVSETVFKPWTQGG